MVIEKSWEWNRDIYAVFIDLEKAFDSVPREKLWETLGNPYYEVEPKLIRVIRSLYVTSKSPVRTGFGLGKWFHVEEGVRQRGVFPLLLIIYIDGCIREVGLEENVGITMAYADNI